MNAIEILDTIFRSDAEAWKNAIAMKNAEPDSVEFHRAQNTLHVWCQILSQFSDEPEAVVYARYAGVAR